MTDERLAEIEEMALVHEQVVGIASGRIADILAQARTDVLELVAEVKRLRTELAEAEHYIEGENDRIRHVLERA